MVDTRPTSRGIRRRRLCLGCGFRWSTREVMVADDVGDDLPAPVELEAALRLLQVALGLPGPYQATGLPENTEREGEG